MSKKKRATLLGDNDNLKNWKKNWKGMPEFRHSDCTPVKSIILHFEDKKDIEDFEKLTDLKVTKQTKSLWFPKVKIVSEINKRYANEGENEDES